MRFKAPQVAFFVAFSYGLLVELLQAFVFFNRSADFGDIIANTIGSVLGIGLFLLIYGIRPLQKG